MTQEYVPSNLTCESESDDSDIFWYDSDEDEDRFCGDVEWEMSLAAVAWEARQKLYLYLHAFCRLIQFLVAL